MEDQIIKLKAECYDLGKSLEKSNEVLEQASNAIGVICQGIADKLEIPLDELKGEGSAEGIFKALEALALVTEE